MVTEKRKRNPLPSDTTFKYAVDRYISQGGPERDLLPIVELLGPSLTIGEVNADVIDRVVHKLGSHRAKSSIDRHIVKPIRVVLNHAFDTGRKRGTGRKPPRWLDPDEAERLIDVASNPQRIGLRDPHLHTLQKIAFMLGTGAMPGEVITIDGKAFARDTGEWSLPGIPSLVQPRVIIPPRRVAELIGDVPFSGPAFVAPNGKPYVVRQKGGGQMAEAFTQICKAADLGSDVTPATCRTTWAVWLYAQVPDLDALVSIGGWAGPRSPKPLTKLVSAGLGQWLIEKGWDFRDSAARHQ
jgi:integrase